MFYIYTLHTGLREPFEPISVSYRTLPLVEAVYKVKVVLYILYNPIQVKNSWGTKCPGPKGPGKQIVRNKLSGELPENKLVAEQIAWEQNRGNPLNEGLKLTS